MTAGLVIFAATYVLIAVQRLPFVHLNRPAASLLGAVAMVVFGVLSLEQAYAAIDFDVLVFLLGLMLIVGYLEVGKFFEWSAEWVLRRSLTRAAAVRPDRLDGELDRSRAGRSAGGTDRVRRIRSRGGVPVTLLTLAWGIVTLVALR
jgi:citrate transporter